MLIAIVRYTRNGNITNIKSELATKKDFRLELKANGIITLGIYTPEQIEQIKIKKHYECSMTEEYIQQML